VNKKVLVGALVGVLVLAASGVGYAAYRVAQKGNEQDRRAAVVTQSRAVDEKLEEIWTRLASRDKAWEAASGGSGTSIDTMLGLTTDDIDGIRKLVADTRKEAAEIPSADLSKSYVAVCDELFTCLDECSKGVEDTKPVSEAYDILITCRDDEDVAIDAISDAIDACNHEKWSTAKTKAQAVQTSYKSIKSKLTKAGKLYDSSTIAGVNEYADCGVKLGTMQYDLAVLGTKGSVNGYNAQIDKMNDQRDKLVELSLLLNTAETTLWSAVNGTYGHFESRATPAKTIWDKAKKSVAAGTY
jgi:hypothetical protein